MKYGLLGLILASLLLGFFAFSFEIRLSNAEPDALTDDPRVSNVTTELRKEWGHTYERYTALDDLEALGLSGSDCDDNDSARLVVGVDITNQRAEGLNRTISCEGGNVTGIISVEGKVRVLTVEVASSQVFSFVERIQTNELVRYVERDTKASATFLPNDPYWSLQWGPRKIEADAAWNTTTGSSGILVAIIDTGIDYTHVDLAANYVSLGYDWVNNDNDPMDDNGHGTHCAGIVSAKLNNGVGIAGLAQVRIMTEKVLDSGGWGYYSWITEGIYHAVAAGAKIISMSLGGSSYSEPLREAVTYARDQNVLVIAGAGNTGLPSPLYPAAYDDVIAVSATDSNDNIAAFSSYGSWIDLAAPGVDVYSTVLGNGYAYKSGTSMACPHVTGVAALVWSVFSNSAADHIRQILLRTADDLGEPGFDVHYGYGRVNARRAVAGIPEHDITIARWKQSRRLDPGETGAFNVTVSNYGKSNETNLLVQFFVNESLIDSATINSLEVDASASLSFSWGTATDGFYNVTCYVVPVSGEDIVENNVARSSLVVRFPAILRVPKNCLTIKAALNDAYDGDTIRVSEGRYAEGQIDVLKDNVTLIADGQVTLDGCKSGNVLNILANDVVVDGFDIRNGSSYGVNVRGYGNVVRRNVIADNVNGVHFHSSENCVLEDNLLTGNENGIDFEYSLENTIRRNRVVGDSFFGGINLWRSFNNSVAENRVFGGIAHGALFFYLSENNIIVSNDITGTRCGLALIGSPNNVLRNNTMAENSCNFAPWLTDEVHYSWRGPNDVDASNTVDGKPIYYWVNVSDRAVPSDAGCVVLVNCRNITAENLDIKNNYNGILLINSSNIFIRRNNITHNWANYDYESSGVLASSDSYDITITQNNIAANSNGLYVLGHNNTISMNNITNNFYDGVDVWTDSIVIQNNITGQQGAGVFVGGSGCTVSSNYLASNLAPNIEISLGSNDTVTLNNIIGNGEPDENIFSTQHIGVSISLSTNCTITQNNFIKCGQFAMFTDRSSGSIIFHNNFIDNPKDLWNYDQWELSSNTWDANASGGNFWSSYHGTDSDGDGIGDTPYILDANNTDNYPLMRPMTENPPPQICSLRIIGWIDNSTIKGFYDTTYPRPGTYVFMANSSIRIDTNLFYSTFVDQWEVDGVRVGSDSFIMVLTNRDHVLKAFLSKVRAPRVSITPVAVHGNIGESVAFVSSVSGGKPPYNYQWYLNGSEVLDGTAPTWVFTPEKLGMYCVSLSVSYPFSTPPFSLPVKSNNSTIIVGPLFNVTISPTSAVMCVGESVEFVSTISGGFPQYSYQWRVDDQPVLDATSSWAFVPSTPGVFNISLKVVDGLGFMVESNVSLVTVLARLAVSISPTQPLILVNQAIEFTSTMSGGFPPYYYQWYLDDRPASGAKSDKWTFTSAIVGNYYIFLKVTDTQNRTNQSTTIRVTVTSTLVGGYSVPQRRSATGLSSAHLVQIAMITAGFTLIRHGSNRKRKQ